MRELPVDYDPNDTVTLAIPRALIPIIAGLISKLETGWEDADQEQGRQIAYTLEERLVT